MIVSISVFLSRIRCQNAVVTHVSMIVSVIVLLTRVSNRGADIQGVGVLVSVGIDGIVAGVTDSVSVSILK